MATPLAAFTEKILVIAKRRFRPVVDVGHGVAPGRDVLILLRRPMLAGSGNEQRCLGCDTPPTENLHLGVNAGNPLVKLERPVSIFMLCCKHDKCKRAVGAYADILASGDVADIADQLTNKLMVE